ncbi:DUF6090 family protein [Robertkochia flava]|uniref:DUF6090 family protein n=1 Tax=Robertkochia flava TaxID=3447986 RepID=UPI001CD018A2|nr:DUF6090 family protein [Robertkochia marina]
MLKLFRNIRHQLVNKGKFRKYLFYATGEIFLVVMGILIAIQINGWNQRNHEKELEKKYLSNLVTELKQDAIGLGNNLKKLKDQARTKELFLNMVKNNNSGDSLLTYFNYQWQPISPYIPLKSTYTEMLNNSHLKVIQNTMLRERIIRMYNTYEVLEKQEDFMTQTATTHVMDLISKNIPDMSDYTKEDILALRTETYALNAIQLNGAFTRRNIYQRVADECAALISEINAYHSSL